MMNDNPEQIPVPVQPEPGVEAPVPVTAWTDTDSKALRDYLASRKMRGTGVCNRSTRGAFGGTRKDKRHG